jgi:hypothetical protein
VNVAEVAPADRLRARTLNEDLFERLLVEIPKSVFDEVAATNRSRAISVGW